MSKKRGEDKERVKTFEKRRGGKKGLEMLKKKGEDIKGLRICKRGEEGRKG